MSRTQLSSSSRILTVLGHGIYPLHLSCSSYMGRTAVKLVRVEGGFDFKPHTFLNVGSVALGNSFMPSLQRGNRKHWMMITTGSFKYPAPFHSYSMNFDVSTSKANRLRCPPTENINLRGGSSVTLIACELRRSHDTVAHIKSALHI